MHEDSPADAGFLAGEQGRGYRPLRGVDECYGQAALIADRGNQANGS
jgi:hypothetical protein